jgi:hypothetical protein
LAYNASADRNSTGLSDLRRNVGEMLICAMRDTAFSGKYP